MALTLKAHTTHYHPHAGSYARIDPTNGWSTIGQKTLDRPSYRRVHVPPYQKGTTYPTLLQTKGNSKNSKDNLTHDIYIKYIKGAWPIM